MVRRIFSEVMCRPEDLKASRDDCEIIGTFNPGAIEMDGQVVLMVRVAERPKEKRVGFTPLPHIDPHAGYTIDWIADDDLDLTDPRVVRTKRDGMIRLRFVSHLRVMISRDGRSIDQPDVASFLPETPFETYGVEDPRIVRLGDRYYVTYVAVSKHGPATALASTADFISFQRHGVIFPLENKDVVLFPEQIDGEYIALHRPFGGTPFTAPEMWIAHSPDLIHWGQHRVVFGGEHGWGAGRIGAGAPPIRIDGGWLEIYHGNAKTIGTSGVGAYAAGAALLDLDQPWRVLRKSPEPIFTAEADHERRGFVPDVVFPTGIVERGDTLLIYYGAADTSAAVVALPRDEVISAMV